jgi:thiol-disulfide isomerase/thioredoxin
MKNLGNPGFVRQYLPAVLLFVSVLLSHSLTAAAEDEPMLYFFTSKGCAPCIQVKHAIKQLDSEGYPVTTVDVGQRPDWADAFRVTRTPTLALVRNNEVIAYQPRLMRVEELRDWFRTIQYVPNKSNARVKPASRTAADANAKSLPPQTKVSLASNRSNSKLSSPFTSPTMLRGTRTPKNEIESIALDSTVRLRVEDERGISYATGTVIHTHEGESLVLTCGHVFRDSQGEGEITAEFGFESGSPTKVPGKLLDYDSDANDIALVVIQNGTHKLGSVEVASAESIVDRGDNVFSLGCDNGDDPTIRNTAIKNIARYDGSLKYDIFGRPVNGRSGGGLFNSKGQLVGVCNAAAVEVDEGIYTALETVHWQLAKTNLDHLFNNTPPEAQPDRTAIASNMTAQPDRTAIASNMTAQPDRTAIASNMARPSLAPTRKMVPIRQLQPAPTRSVRGTLASQVQNVSFEQPASDSSDREVIITVRSKSNPENSRTITISDPTPKLLDYLGGMDGDETRSLKMAQYRQWR